MISLALEQTFWHLFSLPQVFSLRCLPFLVSNKILLGFFTLFPLLPSLQHLPSFIYYLYSSRNEQRSYIADYRIYRLIHAFIAQCPRFYENLDWGYNYDQRKSWRLSGKKKHSKWIFKKSRRIGWALQKEEMMGAKIH